MTLRLLRITLLGTAAALVLSGCATTPLPTKVDPSAVNADYKMGRIDIPILPVPTLDDVINKAPSGDAEAKSAGDKLRGGAMKDAALSYGARAGLAWESRVINRMLMDRTAMITRTYDFQRVMIKGPGDVTILPPVISQAKEAWETSEAGRTLRVADTVYEIVEQARFTAVPPLWQAYLVRDYKSPESPPDSLLPRDGTERDQWKVWVTDGWNMGIKQAREIFEADLDRLERDFTGMVRYKALLEQGKVSAPIVTDARFGTTGTGQDMRVNDRAVRITRDPTLQVQTPQGWSAAPTTVGPDGVTTGGAVNQAAHPAAAPADVTNAPAKAVRKDHPRKAWDDQAAPAPAKAAPAPAKAEPSKPVAPQSF